MAFKKKKKKKQIDKKISISIFPSIRIMVQLNTLAKINQVWCCNVLYDNLLKAEAEIFQDVMQTQDCSNYAKAKSGREQRDEYATGSKQNLNQKCAQLIYYI